MEGLTLVVGFLQVGVVCVVFVGKTRDEETRGTTESKVKTLRLYDDVRLAIFLRHIVFLAKLQDVLSNPAIRFILYLGEAILA